MMESGGRNSRPGKPQDKHKAEKARNFY